MGESFGTKTQTARKQHVCYWCGEKIIPGEKYTSWCWVDYGSFDSVKVHPECKAAWDSLEHYESDEIGFAEFCRGCKCEQGFCTCKTHIAAQAEGEVDHVNEIRVTRREKYTQRHSNERQAPTG